MKKKITLPIVLLLVFTGLLQAQWQGNSSSQYFFGKVGIGLNAPTVPLEIYSIPNQGIKLKASGVSSQIRLQVASGDYGFLELGGGTRLRGNGWFSTFDGSVSIGTSTPPQGNAKLAVAGEIRAEKVRVMGDITGADFVFAENYNLISLAEIEQFIKTHKHLPEIESAIQMQEEGIDITDLQIKLLQKIEELTLHMIQLNKEKATQAKLIEELKLEVQQLKSGR